MPAMTAQVTTDQASRYLNRLCKHFSHKVPATWDGHHGRLDFDIGQCRLEAGNERLVLHCQARDQGLLAELGQVVASHLERFAAGAVAAVQWQATGD